MKDCLQSSFHHILEWFVILTLLVLEFHVCSILVASLSMICLSNSQSMRFIVSSNLKTQMTFLMNSSSCSLFFNKKSLVFIMYSYLMVIVIVRGAWSEISLQDGWITWWLSLLESLWRNIRSNTESDTISMSEYIVGIGLIGTNSSKLNKSTRINRSSLIKE